MSPDGDQASITRLLNEWSAGRHDAANEVFPFVYAELKRLAQRIAPANAGATLNATALVDELYVRLLNGNPHAWSSRAHLYCVAARAMRQIVLDHARARRRLKRAEGRKPIPLDVLVDALEDRAGNIESLDEELSKLEEFDPNLAQLVNLRFYAGMAMREVSELVGRPLRTLERDWETARTWLATRLARGLDG